MRKIPFHPQKSVVPAFMTPIGTFRVPGADKLNPGLEKEILRRMETETGKTRSNVGGWHSNDDLFTWEPPEFKELQQWVHSAIIRMVSLASRTKRFTCQLKMAGWANVNGPGQFNTNHNHPGCVWSGVYYVKAGDYSEDPLPRAGQLQFYDPRGSINMIQHPGKSIFGHQVNIEPKDGRLIIFPAWLFHSVNPFLSEIRRLSIAFNVEIRSFKVVEDDAPQAQQDAQTDETGGPKAAAGARSDGGAGKQTAAKPATGKKTAAKKTTKKAAGKKTATKKTTKKAAGKKAASKKATRKKTAKKAAGKKAARKKTA